MPDDRWITVKEAAALWQMNVDYFRRTFLDPERPLVRVCCPPAAPGAKRRRRLLVLEADILKLMKPE
jgi:hypothetical protein